MIEHTKSVIYLEDYDMLHFKNGNFRCYNYKNMKERVDGGNHELTVPDRVMSTLEMELENINKGKL